VSVLEAIVLGIVQGLSEFLPISSTAHLRIVPAVLGWGDPGAAFTAVTQLGTIAAVLIYFRADLWRISRAWLGSLRSPRGDHGIDARLGWYIIAGTVPIAVLGLLLEDQIETSARSLYVIAAALIAFSAVMTLSERVATQHRNVDSIRLRDGVLLGFAQALALVPGISRSGATIAAGLFLGLDRAGAARFSFLLSIPAIVLSGVFQLLSILGGPEAGETAFVPLLLATVLAFVSGYLSIAFLLRFLVSHSVNVFVGYRVVLGVIVVVLVSTGLIS